MMQGPWPPWKKTRSGRQSDAHPDPTIKAAIEDRSGEKKPGEDGFSQDRGGGDRSGEGRPADKGKTRADMGAGSHGFKSQKTLNPDMTNPDMTKPDMINPSGCLHGDLQPIDQQNSGKKPRLSAMGPMWLAARLLVTLWRIFLVLVAGVTGIAIVLLVYLATGHEISLNGMAGSLRPWTKPQQITFKTLSLGLAPKVRLELRARDVRAPGITVGQLGVRAPIWRPWEVIAVWAKSVHIDLSKTGDHSQPNPSRSPLGLLTSMPWWPRSVSAKSVDVRTQGGPLLPTFDLRLVRKKLSPTVHVVLRQTKTSRPWLEGTFELGLPLFGADTSPAGLDNPIGAQNPLPSGGLAKILPQKIDGSLQPLLAQSANQNRKGFILGRFVVYGMPLPLIWTGSSQLVRMKGTIQGRLDFIFPDLAPRSGQALVGRSGNGNSTALKARDLKETGRTDGQASKTQWGKQGHFQRLKANKIESGQSWAKKIQPQKAQPQKIQAIGARSGKPWADDSPSKGLQAFGFLGNQPWTVSLDLQQDGVTDLSRLDGASVLGLSSPAAKAEGGVMVRGGRLHGRVSSYADGALDGALMLEGQPLAFSLRLLPAKSALQFSLQGKGEFPMQALPKLWPLGAAIQARQWVTEHCKSGLLQRPWCLLKAQYASPLGWTISSVQGGFGLQNAGLWIVKDLPAITGLNLSALYDAKGLVLRIQRGLFTRHQLSGCVTIGPFDLATTPLLADLNLVGPFSWLWPVLAKFAQVDQTAVQDVQGQDKTHLKLQLPLLKEVSRKDITVALKSVVKRGAFRVKGAPIPLAVTQGDFVLSSQEGLLSVQGKSQVNGMPSQWSWTPSCVLFGLKAGPGDLSTLLGVDVRPYINGTANLKGRHQGGNLVLQISLLQAQANLPFLGWHKPSGTPWDVAIDLGADQSLKVRTHGAVRGDLMGDYGPGGVVIKTGSLEWDQSSLIYRKLAPSKSRSSGGQHRLFARLDRLELPEPEAQSVAQEATFAPAQNEGVCVDLACKKLVWGKVVLTDVATRLQGRTGANFWKDGLSGVTWTEGVGSAILKNKKPQRGADQKAVPKAQGGGKAKPMALPAKTVKHPKVNKGDGMPDYVAFSLTPATPDAISAARKMAFASAEYGHNKSIDSDGKQGQGHLEKGGGLAFLRPEISGPRATDTEIQIDVSDVGRFLIGLGISPSTRAGRGRFWVTRIGEKAYTGYGQIDSVQTQSLSLGKLLALVSPIAFVELFSSGLSFYRVSGDFVYQKGILTLCNAQGKGVNLGLLIDGQVHLASQKMALKGTVIPSYFLNTFFQYFPFLGSLMGGESGLISSEFSCRGSLDNPKISVRPFSLFKVGFLKSLFAKKGAGCFLPPGAYLTSEALQNHQPRKNSSPNLAPTAPAVPTSSIMPPSSTMPVGATIPNGRIPTGRTTPTGAVKGAPRGKSRGEPRAVSK
jgi:hypothetical protein